MFCTCATIRQLHTGIPCSEHGAQNTEFLCEKFSQCGQVQGPHTFAWEMIQCVMIQGSSMCSTQGNDSMYHGARKFHVFSTGK